MLQNRIRYRTFISLVGSEVGWTFVRLILHQNLKNFKVFVCREENIN